MVNDTLLNFGKRYNDILRVIFDQWLKLHLGLDALSNQKILKGIYFRVISYIFFRHQLQMQLCNVTENKDMVELRSKRKSK